MLGVEFSSNAHVFCQDGLLSVVHIEHNNIFLIVNHFFFTAVTFLLVIE
jgi:hypothetical protein